MTQIPATHSSTYATADLGLSAALVCLGVSLLELDRSNPRKMRFVFGDSPDIARYEADFWSDRLSVNPRAYFDNLKMLKARIYS
jgi:hypothetical protein